MSSCASLTARRTAAICAERRQRRGVGLERRAHGLLSLSDRLCRQHAVETDLAGEPGVDRARRRPRGPRRRARALSSSATPDSCASDGGMASMAASTSGQAPARSAARTRHGARRIGQRDVPRLAVPLRGERIELARRVESDPRVPVRAVGFGAAGRAASPRPRGRRRRRCAPRARAHRARDRGRPVASSGIRPGRARARARVDVREFPRRDPVGGRQVDRDRLRNANVAGFGRQAEARASILDGELALRDQRGEQRLAGLRRRLAREPERLRVRRARRRRRAGGGTGCRSRRARRPRPRAADIGRRRSTTGRASPATFSQSTRSRSASGVSGQRARNAPISASVAVSSRSFRCQYST